MEPKTDNELLGDSGSLELAQECPICGSKLELIWQRDPELEAEGFGMRVVIKIMCSNHCGGILAEYPHLMGETFNQQDLIDRARQKQIPLFLKALKGGVKRIEE